MRRASFGSLSPLVVPDTRLQMSRTGSCESGIQGVVQDGSARMEEQRGKVLSSTFVIEDWVPAKNCGEARGGTAGRTANGWKERTKPEQVGVRQ